MTVGVTFCERLCRTLCTLTPDKLPGVSYDPLTHSRHNAGDRSVRVGHEIKVAVVGEIVMYTMSRHVTDIAMRQLVASVVSVIVSSKHSPLNPLH